MLWAFLYVQLERFHPGSFTVPAAASLAEYEVAHRNRLANFLYFSFTTLTTLGYGDILPATPVARGTTVLEAFFGQLYLAILVARGVGIQINQWQERRSRQGRDAGSEASAHRL